MVSPSCSDSSERSLAEKSYLALAMPKLLMLPPVRRGNVTTWRGLKKRLDPYGNDIIHFLATVLILSKKMNIISQHVKLLL